MFRHTFAEYEHESQRPWTITVSLLVQSLAVCVAVLIPLLGPHSLPARHWVSQWLAPVPPAASSSAPAEQASRATAPLTERFDQDILEVPTEIPHDLPAALVTNQAAPVGIVGIPSVGVTGSTSGIDPGFSRTPPVVAQPPPVVPPAPQPPESTSQPPVRIGGRVQEAKLVHQVSPMYPALARQARISGVVHLEAIIGEDGEIRELRVLRGHPLLVRSALDAVKQWRYRPTLLNGRTVEVITQIAVNFTLR